MGIQSRKSIQLRTSKNLPAGRTSGASVVRLLPAVILLFVLASGCRDEGATVWSSEVPSPDGLWLAKAATKQWGGPGTAYVATAVELKWVRGSQPPVQVLSFADQTAYPIGVTAVEMQWVTPKHLNVVYGRHATIGFQAVKCADISISVQQQSIANDDTSRR
jgi:hypothetical protein